MVRARGVNDYEYLALRQLQAGTAAPPPGLPVWGYLLSIGLVWIDRQAQPPIVRLTPEGRRYSTDDDLPPTTTVRARAPGESSRASSSEGVDVLKNDI
jgi:hypothetical protein